MSLCVRVGRRLSRFGAVETIALAFEADGVATRVAILARLEMQPGLIADRRIGLAGGHPFGRIVGVGQQNPN